MKWKLFFLLFLFIGLVGGCIGPQINKTDWLKQQKAYILASEEHRRLIEVGRFRVGMTIEECQLAWGGPINSTPFKRINVFETSHSRQELWKKEFIPGPPERLYLHVEDGIVTAISDYRRE